MGCRSTSGTVRMPFRAKTQSGADRKKALNTFAPKGLLGFVGYLRHSKSVSAKHGGCFRRNCNSGAI